MPDVAFGPIDFNVDERTPTMTFYLLRRVLKFAAALSVPVMISACASGGSGEGACRLNNTAVGAIGGAAVGGLVAHAASKGDPLLTGVGAAIGGLAGIIVGDEIDRTCREKAVAEAMNRMVAVDARTPPKPNKPNRYEKVSWSNSESGRSGTIEPLGSYTDNATGQKCGSFAAGESNGAVSQARACLGPDGKWAQVD